MAICGGEDHGEAVFLLDLQKPLAAEHASLPGRLLRDVTLELSANTELAVYALADYAEAPRMLLGRLCKPYDNEQLMVDAAKDESAELRDCDNPPAQIGPSVRDSARQFCEERSALVGRIDLLAGQARNATVGSAHLIEAIEETGRDFQRRPGPKSLYLFSDMMQHAKWFSHIETGPNRWDAESFAELRASHTAQPGGAGYGADVTIFYLTHEELATNPQQRLAHQAFWRSYFGEAPVAFNEQAPVLGYRVEPLMNVATEAELLAQERERLRYARIALDRMRAELERSEQTLASERQRHTEEARRRESEFRRERERLREQLAEISSERDRLAQLALVSEDGI